MAQGAKEDGVVTPEESSGSPPTFNWTEEEKALLRRTLRVRVLEEDRIEIETREPGTLLARLIGFGILLAILCFIFPPVHYASAPIIDFIGLGAYACILGTGVLICFLREPPPSSKSISLFPGTRWCVRHRTTQGSLELLVAQEPNPPHGLRRRRVVLRTDIGDIHLNVPSLARATDCLACHKILSNRCKVTGDPAEDAPATVASLAEPGALSLPWKSYVLLLKNLPVEQVGPTSLVLRNDRRRWRRILVFLSLNVVLMLLPIILLAAGVIPDKMLLGANQSGWILLTGFLCAPLVLGVGEGLAVMSSSGACRKYIIALSKDKPEITVRGPDKVETFSRATCHVEVSYSTDDSPAVLSIKQSTRSVARWDLPADDISECDLLEEIVQSYISRSTEPRR
jgi:hypothetical protein